MRKGYNKRLPNTFPKFQAGSGGCLYDYEKLIDETLNAGLKAGWVNLPKEDGRNNPTDHLRKQQDSFNNKK